MDGGGRTASGTAVEDVRQRPPVEVSFPESLDRAIAPYKAEELFQEFPFGTDFTTQEIILAKTLKDLKHHFSNKRVMLSDILHAVFRRRVSDAAYPYLERLKLDKPATFKEKLTQRLVANALARGWLHRSNASERISVLTRRKDGER